MLLISSDKFETHPVGAISLYLCYNFFAMRRFINLLLMMVIPVPFLCQAPDANWKQPWQDACEEAAIVMAMHYVNGTPLDRKVGRQEILSLVNFQIKKYGGHYDLTAQQSAQLIKDYYGYKNLEVSYNFLVEDIKKELDKGNLVIAPMAGRMLGNPYYTPPGPVYHYMLFKGYDDKRGEFIANDAGTNRGKDYRYKYLTAFKAIHDWTGDKSTIGRGKKAILIIKK